MDPPRRPPATRDNPRTHWLDFGVFPSKRHAMPGHSKKDRIAREFGTFLRQYERKAQRGREPNDRTFDHSIVRAIRHLSPLALSRIMSGDADESE